MNGTGYYVFEPSYLELRGAMTLLRNALKRMPKSEWRGSEFHYQTIAEREAYSILTDAETQVSKELSLMLHPVVCCKECGQEIR